MVSFLCAGIQPSASIDAVVWMPEWLTREAHDTGNVAGFVSESCPASNRNAGRLRLGISGRHQIGTAAGITSESALNETVESTPAPPVVPDKQLKYSDLVDCGFEASPIGSPAKRLFGPPLMLH
jgi:hypothetical protein